MSSPEQPVRDANLRILRRVAVLVGVACIWCITGGCTGAHGNEFAGKSSLSESPDGRPLAESADSVSGGNAEIPPQMIATGVLYIHVINVRGKALVGRCITIEGRTYVYKGKPDLKEEAEFCDVSRLPFDCLEPIWLAADDFVRTSKELQQPGWPPTKEGFLPGNYLDICFEGRNRQGEYMFRWPLDKEPSDPKARKLLALMKKADALDGNAKVSPFRPGGKQ